MKISSFNPMILTKDAKAAIKLFETLGFRQKHAPMVDAGKGMVASVMMTDANGFRIDVADAQNLERDMTVVRMNVDDFDEAYEMLTAKGFARESGYHMVSTPSSKSTLIKSPSGFAIYLVQHIKK